MERSIKLCAWLCVLLLGLQAECRVRRVHARQDSHHHRRYPRLLRSARKPPDFISVSVNSEGQRELRVAFRHHLLLETTAAPLSRSQQLASAVSGAEAPSPSLQEFASDSFRTGHVSPLSQDGFSDIEQVSKSDDQVSSFTDGEEKPSSFFSSSFPTRATRRTYSSRPILRQVTDGRRIVSGVFEDGALRDCDISRSPLAILQFLDEFKRNLTNLRLAPSSDVFKAYRKAVLVPSSSRQGNDTVAAAFKMVKNRKDLGEFDKLVLIRHQIRPCRALLKDMRRLSRKAEKDRAKNDRGASSDEDSSVEVEGGASLENTANSLQKDSASDSKDSEKPSHATDSKHRKTHFPGRDVHSGHSKTQTDTNKTTTFVRDPLDFTEGLKTYPNSSVLEDHHGDASRGRRHRRSLLSGWFIFPGTKWCGDGDVAESEEDLGYDQELDKCCRKHDLCRHVIPRLSWRYELFNFRLHTMSHCKCDRGFRRCLQRVSSPSSSMVGKIYFNVIGPQCFKLSKHQACLSRTWWGACLKYGTVKRATPRYQRGF